MNRHSLIHHLIRPARGGAAAVVIVFSVLLAFGARAGIMGLPLAIMLTSWFFKYTYIVFDHSVRGVDNPPTLDIQMLNPLEEQRPLAQVAILGLIYVAVNFAQSRMGPAAGWLIAIVALLFLPASVAILGLEGNPLKAAYPVSWVRMVVGLGPMYLLVLAVIGGYAVLIVWIWHWELWLPVQIAIFMFCILSVFSVLGGALFERRHEVGLEVWASPERTEELRRTQERRESEKEVWDAYGKMRAGSHTEAWAKLQAWLASRGNAIDDYRWLCGRVAAWGDPRYVTRMTQDYVERLLTLKQSGEALDAVAARLAENPSFRPKSAAATLEIARIAADGGGKAAVARCLLSDFPARFPQDPGAAAAAELARRLA